MDIVPDDESGVIDPGCDSAPSMESCLHFSLIPAVLIVGVLSFLQRRKTEHAIDRRFPSLQRRFGIVIPIDAMGFSNRWSYGFAFGAISYSVVELFQEQHMPRVFPSWAKAIAYLIGGFEVGLVYFPFFACLSTPFRITGAVMGILYSIGWIIIVGYDWFICPSGERWGHYQKLIYQWPWMLSLIFLLGRFIFLLVKAVKLQRKSEQEDSGEIAHVHQTQHVKRLLSRTTQSKPLSWFERHIYEWDPHFKFPNRLIGTVIISLLALYTLLLTDLGFSSYIFKKLEGYLIPDPPYYHPAPDELSTEEILDISKKCVHVTLASASLNMVVYICHVLVCYRKQIKRLWKGQKDYLPIKLQNPSSAVSVASIAKYCGWQIAFILWGFLIIRIVHLLPALIIAYGVIEMKYGNAWIILTNLGTLLITFGLIFGLFKLQVLLVQYFFLQDKMSDTDKEKPLALNNRNAFNCFNYFFFFYNTVMGITSCLLRMMISFALGTWLVSRIDRTIMQKGYETLDMGFRTWVGMIFADHYHNNPVMVCFCQLLLCGFQQKQHHPDYSILHNTPYVSDTAKSRVMKRWRLFYTLLKNPHLIPLRKHHLSAKVPLKVSSSAQADIVVRAWLMRSQADPELC